jgi:hypothetical protein
MLSVEHWVDFYRKHDTYKFVGVMEGRYYTAEGKRTKHWEKARMAMDRGRTAKMQQDALLAKYPNCNSKWAQNIGNEVWCDGHANTVPRVLVSEDQTSQRCACVGVETASIIPGVREYPGCDPKSRRCAMELIPDFRSSRAGNGATAAVIREQPPAGVLLH